MKTKTRSILQELNAVAESRSTDSLVETRAANIIKSAINLLESIRKNYTVEQAEELERRLINAIRGRDPAKFTRGVRKIVENRRLQRKLDQND